jgi:hypothetical protein
VLLLLDCQSKDSEFELLLCVCRAFCATIVSRRARRRSILCTTSAHIVAHTTLEQYSHRRSSMGDGLCILVCKAEESRIVKVVESVHIQEKSASSKTGVAKLETSNDPVYKLQCKFLVVR